MFTRRRVSFLPDAVQGLAERVPSKETVGKKRRAGAWGAVVFGFVQFDFVELRISRNPSI